MLGVALILKIPSASHFNRNANAEKRHVIFGAALALKCCCRKHRTWCCHGSHTQYSYTYADAIKTFDVRRHTCTDMLMQKIRHFIFGDISELCCCRILALNVRRRAGTDMLLLEKKWIEYSGRTGIENGYLMFGVVLKLKCCCRKRNVMFGVVLAHYIVTPKTDTSSSANEIQLPKTTFLMFGVALALKCCCR